jgi:hypothetical protein
MSKKTMAKVAGFTAALGVTGALVGFAASGTGAYFTDSHDGGISATTGTVKVAVSPADLSLNFAGLLPGAYQTLPVAYQNQGSGAEDVWLVFPTDGSAEAFVGTAGDAAGGGLGRYGHFALTSSNGASFTSYNLNNAGTGTHSGNSCPIDANGEGGSDAQLTTPNTLLDFCAPANAILLASNLTPGQGGTAQLTFGFTPKLTSQSQYSTVTPVVSYKVVATQHGIRPDDAFNPAS